MALNGPKAMGSLRAVTAWLALVCFALLAGGPACFTKHFYTVVGELRSSELTPERAHGILATLGPNTSQNDVDVIRRLYEYFLDQQPDSGFVVDGRELLHGPARATPEGLAVLKAFVDAGPTSIGMRLLHMAFGAAWGGLVGAFLGLLGGGKGGRAQTALSVACVFSTIGFIMMSC